MAVLYAHYALFQWTQDTTDVEPYHLDIIFTVTFPKTTDFIPHNFFDKSRVEKGGAFALVPKVIYVKPYLCYVDISSGWTVKARPDERFHTYFKMLEDNGELERCVATAQFPCLLIDYNANANLY